ncbi:MAG: hypothetical protein IPM54_17930 [Polyangiaceae bacterium]|nr:hypothetical protein [Polyangiaceae bacterium]
MARPKVVLSKEIRLPARTVRDVRAACNPVFELSGDDLVKLREDLSSVRGGSRLVRMEESIRSALPGEYQIQLLSGHTGSGKSTELRWLARQLQFDKGGRVLYPLFIDIEEYLNPRDIQIPEFIMAIIAALLDDPRVGPDVRASETVKRFWKEVIQWLKDLSVTLESDIVAGLSKLKVTFRTSPGFQESFREQSHKHVKTLIETLSDVIEAARARLIKDDTHDLVIMVDKLDRIERLPLDDKTGRTRHDLFYLEQLPYIQDVPVHFVLTVPVTLHFTQDRLRQVFHGMTNVVLPMVAVHELHSDKPHIAGIEALTKLLARRVDLKETFQDDDALQFAIMESGGCLRDLFRLVSEAVLNKQALKLSRADIEIIAKENASNTERLLQGRSFLRDLHHVAKTGSFPEKFDDATKQWLLYNLIVIEYNGETWYDVHPFARRTRAYREAAPIPAPSP